MLHDAARGYRRQFGDPTGAADYERLLREICRHNPLVNMLSDPVSLIEEAVDIEARGMRRTRSTSRALSGGGTPVNALVGRHVSSE